MNKKIKTLTSYILIFVTTVALLMGFLLASAHIPQSLIQKHMEESAGILCEHNRIWYMIPGVESSQNHLYADAITANIAYHFSNDKPLESVMWARYYWQDGDVNTSFWTAVQNHLGAETQYLRYWHGSAAVVRLLEDETVPKVGLSWHDDILQLHKRAEFTPGNFIDLQKHVGEIGVEDRSLQKLYANFFGQKISKSQQLSNWENDVLQEKQKIYAATDAWACIKLYEELLRLEQTNDFKLVEEEVATA